ncbi:MAG: hypothetical protein HW406_1 [Candidatus Brocadiaceae bacterium]|nr:hypothetical protein [Candidatus Brocadiaceae bacterium]
MELLLKESVLQQVNLRFFDVEAHIKSDSGSFITLFTQMYQRFQADVSLSPVQRTVEFVLLTKQDNQWGKPVMILDGEVIPLDDPCLLDGYAYESILSAIVTRVRSHLLIHAGVVSRAGKGIILVADSSHGKTTLVLELVRRGFQFLSDEMAALGRADLLVHPFPRSLRIRSGTLQLAGFPDGREGSLEWLGKLVLDIGEIKPGCLGIAVPINHIVVLQDQTNNNDNVPVRSGQELSILLDRLDDTLLSDIRRNEDIYELRIDNDSGYPQLKIRAARPISVLSQIETLCRKRQILVVNAVKGVEVFPTFTLSAQLMPLSKNQTVVELLRRFQGGYRSELLQDEFKASSTRLFLELSTLVAQAECHQLLVGPLNEEADLISNMVS